MQSVLLLPESSGYTFSQKIFYYLTTGFILTLFIPGYPVINNAFLGAVCFISFFLWKKDWRTSWKKIDPAYIFMLLFFIWMAASYGWSDNKTEYIDLLATRSPLFLFPLSFLFVQIPAALKKRLLLVFAWSITAAAVFCVLMAIRTARANNDTAFLYNDSLSYAILKQSIYFAMLVNIAIFIYGWLLHDDTGIVRSKGSVKASILFLLIVHFFLASRIAMLVLYPILVVYFARWVIYHKKWKIAAFSLVACVIVGFLSWKLSPKTFNRFREMAFTSYDMQKDGAESHYNMEVTAGQWNGANSRLAIWKNGWEVIKENWLFGTGLGDKKDVLFKNYEKNNFVFALRTKKNLHNNYLDLWMSLGIIGLLLFICGYILFPFLYFRRMHDWLGILIVLNYAAACITEVYIDRTFGAVLTGFIIPFLLLPGTDTKTEREPDRAPV